MELSPEWIPPERMPKNLAEALALFRMGDDVPSPPAVWLATALAERLDAVVPARFHVRAEGAWVSLFDGARWDGSSDVAGILDQDPSTSEDAAESEEGIFADRVVSIGYNVLSSVQDGIAEATTEAWPRLPQGGMANPGTRADKERVYLWYGPDSQREEAAVLSLPPIILAALDRG
jgi:hypothetical protein